MTTSGLLHFTLVLGLALTSVRLKPRKSSSGKHTNLKSMLLDINITMAGIFTAVLDCTWLNSCLVRHWILKKQCILLKFWQKYIILHNWRTGVYMEAETVYFHEDVPFSAIPYMYICKVVKKGREGITEAYEFWIWHEPTINIEIGKLCTHIGAGA